MDWVDVIVFSIIGSVVWLCVFAGGNYLINEYEFSKVQAVRVQATLLSHSFAPSTERTRVAPVVGAKGQVSCAVYITGDPEKKTTVWDCGRYGRLTSENKRIYQYASEKATLLIRHSNYDTRIVGMEIDE